jgi:hypothetical protein
MKWYNMEVIRGIRYVSAGGRIACPITIIIENSDGELYKWTYAVGEEYDIPEGYKRVYVVYIRDIGTRVHKDDGSLTPYFENEISWHPDSP